MDALPNPFLNPRVYWDGEARVWRWQIWEHRKGWQEPRPINSKGYPTQIAAAKALDYYRAMRERIRREGRRS